MAERTGGFNDVCIGAELTPDQVEFGMAMEKRRRDLGRPVAADDAREVLAVARALGYGRVAGADSPRPHSRPARRPVARPAAAVVTTTPQPTEANRMTEFFDWWRQQVCAATLAGVRDAMTSLAPAPAPPPQPVAAIAPPPADPAKALPAPAERNGRLEPTAAAGDIGSAANAAVAELAERKVSLRTKTLAQIVGADTAALGAALKADPRVECYGKGFWRLRDGTPPAPAAAEPAGGLDGLRRRLLEELRHDPARSEALAEDLEADADEVRRALQHHWFEMVNGKWRLTAEGREQLPPAATD